MSIESYLKLAALLIKQVIGPIFLLASGTIFFTCFKFVKSAFKQIIFTLYFFFSFSDNNSVSFLDLL